MFLIVVTISVGAWFLSRSEKVTEEIDDTVNQSVNQTQIINNNGSAVTAELDDNDVIVFQNPEYGFIYKLYENEAVKEEKSDIIYTVYFNSDKLSIMSGNMESAVKDAVSIQTNVVTTVDGLQGEEITATSTKDGSEIKMILVKKDDRLFHFQGTENFLTKIKTQFFFDN